MVLSEALVDLPRSAREVLLADVAAEPGPDLWERLGFAGDCAAELCAAYGARHHRHPRGSEQEHS